MKDLHLVDDAREPFLGRQRSEMKVGDRHHDHAVAFGRKVRDAHLMTAHDRRSERVHHGAEGQANRDGQRGRSNRRQMSPHHESETGHDVGNEETAEGNDQSAHPLGADPLQDEAASRELQRLEESRHDIARAEERTARDEGPSRQNGQGRNAADAPQHVDVHGRPDRQRDEEEHRSMMPRALRVAMCDRTRATSVRQTG